jgi:Ca-activated chloride channel family protein
MIAFAHPWILLLLIPVPVLAWWRARGARRPALRFSDVRLLQKLPVGWAVHAARLLPWIYGLGLACLIVAAARPQRGLVESRIRRDTVDVVLVIDISPSMAAEDFSTPLRRINRLDAAKAVIEEFVRRRPDDRIGAVVFAMRPYTLAPLALDHGFLLERIRSVRVGDVGDATGIGTALASAVNRLRRSEARSKMVILLTDGMNNAGLNTPPEEAAKAAKALGIRVYTIGAGTQGTAPMPVNFFGQTVYQRVPVKIDEDLLSRVAQTTGGGYFRATDLRSLERIYEQIDRMERTEIEAVQYTRFEERFFPWLAAALILLGLERALGLGRLGGLPA